MTTRNQLDLETLNIIAQLCPKTYMDIDATNTSWLVHMDSQVLSLKSLEVNPCNLNR